MARAIAFKSMARAVLCFLSLIYLCFQVQALDALSPLDPSSYSRPEQAVVKHISLSLNVDFDKKILSGKATLDIDILEEINEVFLDVSKLNVESIQAEDGTQLKYIIDSEILFGSKLTISLSSTASNGEKIKLIIKYSTSPEASALQWLEPAQTAGKKHPYLFSQSSPIHARSILPCQDTPGVKITYDAEITAPSEFTVLMSALRGQVKSNVTSFKQPIPISPNLMAIAVGDLEYRTLGPRSKVWSEWKLVDRAAWEFADTETYLQEAEKLCGPYVWKEYDLLVLPPSFPYGGMENPCLTFVTPALLAGDKSLTSTVVHEVMHSWTGNLITPRNFEHFWLKESFTVFLERKISGSLIADEEEGRRSRDFHSLLGLQELKETIEELGSTNPLTKLVLDLKGVHPDDSFSRVPYEKGSLFIRYLEDLFGADSFAGYLRAFIDAFAKKSLDSDQFKAFLMDYFKGSKQLDLIEWDKWLYGTGMPPVIPEYDTSMVDVVTALFDKITENSSFSVHDVESFTPHQLIYLLQALVDSPRALSIAKLEEMGDAYGLVGSQNVEILYRWFRLCIKSRDITKVNDALSFVNSQGRMKYVRPIYRDLYAWQEVRDHAISNFLMNEPFMMHVSAYTIRQDLQLGVNK